MRNNLSDMSKALELSRRAGSDADDELELEGPADPPHFETVKWRIRIGDTDYGPYTRSRLIGFLKEGRVVAGSLLACGSDTTFRRADKHPQLRWDFAAARKRTFGQVKLDPGETELPICNFLIAAHLVGSSAAVEKILGGCGKFARAAGDMWVLRSRMSVQQLRTRLALAMQPHEQLVIVNASKDRLAWHNLGVENDIAVRGVWDNDEDVD